MLALFQVLSEKSVDSHCEIVLKQTNPKDYTSEYVYMVSATMGPAYF